MAKEYTVAEFGHEERKALGKRVGMSKSHQIASQTKLSKNEICVAKVEQNQSGEKVSVSIEVKKVYKNFDPEGKRTSKSKSISRRRKRVARVQKSRQIWALYEGEATRRKFADKRFPSPKSEPTCNALVID